MTDTNKDKKLSPEDALEMLKGVAAQARKEVAPNPDPSALPMQTAPSAVQMIENLVANRKAAKAFSEIEYGDKDKINALIVRLFDERIVGSTACSGSSGEGARDAKVREMFVANREATRKEISQLQAKLAGADLRNVTMSKREKDAVRDAVIDSEDFKPWKIPAIQNNNCGFGIVR